MTFKKLIAQGLLGYQPIFFPNGVITGTGFQFFGNLRTEDEKTEKCAEDTLDDVSTGFTSENKDKFNPKRLGNLYIPPEFGNAEEFNTDYYYCVDETDLPQFANDNLMLLNMYKHFVANALKIATELDCPLESMIEIGANTCLFPFEFSSAGLSECHGADIVDYSSVVNLLSATKGSHVAFHHMPNDSETTWKRLPKADLVWSYAVLVHQANPLSHLAKLASLAKKAMFVMTPIGPDEWKSPDDMGIRYLSANSYYAADFPNCFDVTIVSPELIRYSLRRLGFSRIFEVSLPQFSDIPPSEQKNLDLWLRQHCFYLAFRDTPLDSDELNDYSVDSERSPYNGENIVVHRGFHHSIVLKSSRYFIVPNGHHTANGCDGFHSFANLSNAILHMEKLRDELAPYPVTALDLATHEIIKFRNVYYFRKKGQAIDFGNEHAINTLHSLDNLNKWQLLLSLTDESTISKLANPIVDIVENICIFRMAEKDFQACRIDSDGGFGQFQMRSQSRDEIARTISVEVLLESMGQRNNNLVTLFENENGKFLERTSDGVFQVRNVNAGGVVSKYDSLEEAWRNAIGSAIDIHPR